MTTDLESVKQRLGDLRALWNTRRSELRASLELSGLASQVRKKRPLEGADLAALAPHLREAADVARKLDSAPTTLEAGLRSLRGVRILKRASQPGETMRQWQEADRVISQINAALTQLEAM
jgi:hypothetical protein